MVINGINTQVIQGRKVIFSPAHNQIWRLECHTGTIESLSDSVEFWSVFSIRLFVVVFFTRGELV